MQTDEKIVLHGRNIKLRPIEETDMNILHQWRNDLSSLHLWSIRRHVVSYDEFVAELSADFAKDRHIQLMIEKITDKTVIGTIYSYNVQFVDEHCWITIFIEQDKIGKGFGAEAIALMLAYLFSYFGFHKIYADVYDYNKMSVNCLISGGFIEEGRFKEHRYFAGKRHDMIRYAIYSNQLPYIQQFITRLTRSKK